MLDLFEVPTEYATFLDNMYAWTKAVIYRRFYGVVVYKQRYGSAVYDRLYDSSYSINSWWFSVGLLSTLEHCTCFAEGPRRKLTTFRVNRHLWNIYWSIFNRHIACMMQKQKYIRNFSSPWNGSTTYNNQNNVTQEIT